MPRLALVFALVWFFTLFVFRTFIQWRRTGSTGIVGFHGAIGSLPWWAGATVTAGFALGVLAPAAALLAWPGGRVLFEATTLHIVGAALVSLGGIGGLVAQFDMGDAWRIGVDTSDRTTLVTGGLFAKIRNPIFTFISVSLVGIVLMVPNAWAVAACALTLVGIELQVRGVEEPYLLRTHGDAYARYAARVGRFAPGIGRFAGDGGGHAGVP